MNISGNLDTFGNVSVAPERGQAGVGRSGTDGVWPPSPGRVSGKGDGLPDNKEKKEEKKMSMPKNEVLEDMVETWRSFVGSLELSLEKLEQDIENATKMAGSCTGEKCRMTENLIDDLAHQLFSIHEPRGSSTQDMEKIKALKRRVHDLYANYKTVYKGVSA